MTIAILLYPGLTALDAIGPYEVLNSAPGLDIRFVWKRTGPVVTDHGGHCHGQSTIGRTQGRGCGQGGATGDRI